MQCQLPISCGTSKEQRLTGNSLQLIYPVSPFVHLSVPHASDTSVYFTEKKCQVQRGAHPWAQAQDRLGAVSGTRNGELGGCRLLLHCPPYPLQAEMTLWSTGHRRWVNMRMNSNNSCLLEISFCDCCSRAEKENHIQKMPVGQWPSRGPTSNSSPHFQKHTARRDR